MVVSNGALFKRFMSYLYAIHVNCILYTWISSRLLRKDLPATPPPVSGYVSFPMVVLPTLARTCRLALHPNLGHVEGAGN